MEVYGPGDGTREADNRVDGNMMLCIIALWWMRASCMDGMRVGTGVKGGESTRTQDRDTEMAFLAIHELYSPGNLFYKYIECMLLIFFL